LETAKINIEKIIRDIQKTIDGYISKPNPKTLYDPARYLFTGGGKRLRAVMTLLAYALHKPDYRKALPAAAAVEILHNFSLVHDDIMDNDDLRRGRPTLHKRWDVNVAILSGDLLAAIAYKSLSACDTPKLQEIVEIFSEGFIELCEGQALDKEFESQKKISLKAYLDMIRKKTAALFRVSMHLGVALSGARAAFVRMASDYGRHFGTAFQIQDDLLDVTGDEKTFGKDIGSDLIEKKKTYVTILADQHPDGRRLLEKFHPDNPKNVHLEALKTFNEFLTASRIRHQIESVVDRHLRDAMQCLAAFPDSPARRQLVELTIRMWKRQY